MRYIPGGRARLLILLCFVVLLTAMNAFVRAQSGESPYGRIVSEIRIEGLHNTREELIREQLASRVGSPYTEETAGDDSSDQQLNLMPRSQSSQIVLKSRQIDLRVGLDLGTVAVGKQQLAVDCVSRRQCQWNRGVLEWHRNSGERRGHRLKDQRDASSHKIVLP